MEEQMQTFKVGDRVRLNEVGAEFTELSAGHKGVDSGGAYRGGMFAVRPDHMEKCVAALPVGTEVVILRGAPARYGPQVGEHAVIKDVDAGRRDYLLRRRGVPESSWDGYWMSFDDVEEVAPLQEVKVSELDAFKTRVRDAVIAEAESRGWCEEADEWLKKLGLEGRRKTYVGPRTPGTLVRLTDGSHALFVGDLRGEWLRFGAVGERMHTMYNFCTTDELAEQGIDRVVVRLDIPALSCYRTTCQ